MEKYQNGLLPKDGFSPASGYATWIDYTERMKKTSGVSYIDIEMFTKKYWGFIISRCINKNLNDEYTTEFIKLFFDKFLVKKRFMFDRTKGSFHSWFATVIDREINSFLRKKTSNNRKLEKNLGKITHIEIGNLQPEEEPCYDANWEAEIEKEELVKLYGAMLVWEDVSENAPPEQKLCFLLTLKGYTVSQIAQDININSTKVSDHIRNFKNKLQNSFNKFYAKVDFENLDLNELKQHAEWARGAIEDAISKYKTGNLS